MASLFRTDDITGNITQRDIFRLSAVLYSESNDSISTDSVQTDIIKCILCENDNEAMSEDDIIAAIASNYKYHLSREELFDILRTYKNTFESVNIDGVKKYRLINESFTQTNKSMEKSIDSYIDVFLEERPDENTEQGKYSIHKYLYELTTSNINSYKVLLGKIKGDNFYDSDLSVDVRDLSDHERELVHDFVNWDNAEKNEVLTNLVFCCLEYCLLVNGDRVNPLLINAIRKRTVYLDTNILFRALGINGVNREKVMIAFLKKCRQAGLSIVVLHETEKEFEDTVRYYISQIRAFPRGKVYGGAFEQISDYNIFSFYDEWRAKHESLSLAYFSQYIKSLYLGLCEDYKIIRNQKIPNDVAKSDLFRQHCIQYARSINLRKQQVKENYIPEDVFLSARDIHDATVVSYVEHLRKTINDTEDVFLTSSDKALRYWDMTRFHDDYPVVIYPSQLFLVLIKICGRSENDFESFVSFINIRPKSKQMTAEKANIILSGISSITEDLQTQRHLVDSVFSDDFQSIVQHSTTDQDLYQNVCLYSENYLNETLKEKDSLLQEALNTASQKDEKIIELSDSIEESRKKQEQQQGEISKHIESLEKKNAEIETTRARVCQFAEKKTKLGFVLKWYIFPLITLALVLVYVYFIISQFFFCDKPWNIANKVFSFIANTTFGKNVNDYYVQVDAAAFVLLSVVVIPLFWVKPWDIDKKEADKQNRIEQYIKKNHLL